jgi:DNA repair exonuclease SbcCD ATPase subunit
MRLTELEVKNYGTFKSAKIDLDHKGITTIFGLNKDAASIQGGSYTNASGKSLLFTSIPEAAFGNPPSGKDQLKHTNSSIKLTFKGKTDVVSFDKQYGKSKKITIVKNGKDVHNRTLDYGQQKLQQCLGVSEEEDFYTSRYIDNTLPHPLIVGKAAHRQSYFVKLFNLENVDAIRHLLLAELREIQKASGTYHELQDMFQQAKAKALTKDEIEKKRTQEAELKASQQSMIDRLNKYQVVRDLLSFEETNAKLLKRFRAQTSLETFAEDYSKFKDRRKAVKALIEQGEEWRTYETLREAYDEAKVKADSLLGKLGLEGLKKDDLQERATTLEKAGLAYAKATSELEELELDKPEEVEDPSVEIPAQEKKVSRLEDEYEASRNFKEGKCPTCGAPFKGREHSHVKEDLEKARKKLKKAKAYEAYTEAKKTYKKNKARAEELKEQIKALERKTSELAKVQQGLAALAKVPRKPTEPEGKRRSLKELRVELEELNEKIERFKTFKEVIEQIESLEALTDKERNAAAELNTLTDKMASVNSKLNVLTAEITSGIEARKQLKDLATRGEALKAMVEDEPIVKALIDAYSKKGIKKLLIQRYASVLEAQINKFTRMFFAEDITFELKYGSKFEFLAHKSVVRKTKKDKKAKPKTVTIDVKRLSGAERRMLTLVLVVATLSMQPKDKRTNVLILDEPEANMGPEAVNTFSKAIVALTKVIPHIVVITPRPELNIEGSRVFTVVKRNGVSTLEKGKVSV